MKAIDTTKMTQEQQERLAGLEQALNEQTAGFTCSENEQAKLGEILNDYTRAMAEADWCTAEVHRAAKDIPDFSGKAELVAFLSRRKEALQQVRTIMQKATALYVESLAIVSKTLVESEDLGYTRRPHPSELLLEKARAEQERIDREIAEGVSVTSEIIVVTSKMPA